jgi:hypothetical protein
MATEAAIYNYEQELLLCTLDSLEVLYSLRRESKITQQFWNQFWHKWEFPILREAYLQAFRDMAEDPSIYTIKSVPTTMSFRNFEKAVASDQHRFHREILSLLDKDYPSLLCDGFYQKQFFVQEYFEYHQTLYGPINEGEQKQKKSVKTTKTDSLNGEGSTDDTDKAKPIKCKTKTKSGKKIVKKTKSKDGRKRKTR